MSKFNKDRPRQHYYDFAHRVLPRILLQSAEPFRGAALAGRAEGGLQRLWTEVASKSHGSTGDAQVTARLDPCKGRAIVLIRPPRAEHVTEPHFIAVVLDEADSQYMRYIVLEHSWDLQSRPCTILGEWTKEGHVNYGPGPDPPTAEAFLTVVCERFIEPPSVP